MTRPIRHLLVVALATAALTGATTSAASAAPHEGVAAGDCSRSATATDTTVEVTFGGVPYPVLVHVPGAGTGEGRLPLVLNLHGSSSNGSVQMDISGLREVADEEGFVVAAPTAAIPLVEPSPDLPLGGWAWNVPGVPTTAGAFPPADARDDVAFLDEVVDEITEQLCTDPRRTYATGFSGGGRMASTLACELPDVFAAIAPVAGLRAGRPDPDDVTVPEVEDCQPGNPVPVLTFHGEQDQVNPYAGNGDLRWGYAVPLAVQTWARLDGCRVGPEATRVGEQVTLFEYSQCRRGAEVDFYSISDGGHTWPGTDVPLPDLGTVTQEVDAAAVMWDFFADHRLRG